MICREKDEEGQGHPGKLEECARINRCNANFAGRVRSDSGLPQKFMSPAHRCRTVAGADAFFVARVRLFIIAWTVFSALVSESPPRSRRSSCG